MGNLTTETGLPPPVRTDRIDLIATTLDHLEAELVSTKALGVLLEATVPESWPPGEYDRSAIEFFHARLTENPGAAGWYGWYALLRPARGEIASLIGGAGFLGPPGPDGIVEIGYSIAPEFQVRAFATEIVQALTAHALEIAGVLRVIAHTSSTNAASIRVLERCGFERAGQGGEPGTIRFETALRCA